MSEYENLVLSSELIMVELPPLEIWKDDVSGVSPLSELETSGFQIFQIFTLPPMLHHSFFKTTKKFVCRNLVAKLTRVSSDSSQSNLTTEWNNSEVISTNRRYHQSFCYLGSFTHKVKLLPRSFAP